MGAILAAMANGAVVSALLGAVVWLVLRLTPRRTWNAATRYAAGDSLSPRLSRRCLKRSKYFGRNSVFLIMMHDYTTLTQNIVANTSLI